ncbi:MAG: tetratricopeptide repeat protein [Rhodospirillales bacterium]|nr:tetratricopeptide repeat protein [Rhodospirillales bacterium]
MNRAEKRRQQKRVEKKRRSPPASGQPLGNVPDIPQELDLALQSHQAGALLKAEDIYQKILEVEPNQPDALHFLGLIAHQMGRNEVAVDLISKALAITPENVDAHYNLGLVFFALEKLEEAAASFGKAIAINPDYAEAHCNLGNALNDLGRLDEAAANYNKALAINPDYADACYNLGNTYKELGRLDEAVAAYNKALAINPDLTDAHQNVLYAKQKRAEEYIFQICCEDKRECRNADQIISEDKKHDRLKVNLLYCPFSDPVTPPLGITSLKSYLEKYGNSQVRCMDLSLQWHNKFTQETGPGFEALTKGEKLFKSDDGSFYNIDLYRDVSDKFADVLQAAHQDIKYSLCQDSPSQETDIIDFLKPLALKGNPDVVGFSVLFYEQLLCSLLLAREIKKERPETIIVFGGAGMLTSGKQVMQNPDVDFIIFEAGEASFNKLLNSIKVGIFDEKIEGVAYKKSGICIKNEPIPGFLNHDAFPDFSDLKIDEYFTPEVVIPILTSKGCFWRKCSFCEEGSVNQYAEALVSRVVDELEYHYSNGFTYFQFVDEMITPERLRLLSEEIIRRKLKVFFYGTLRPTSDFKEEILHLMYEAGFRYVIWGVESCNRRVLKLVNKGTSIKSITNTLKFSKNAGIRNHVFMFVGFPSETPDELLDTMQFFYDNQENIHQIHTGEFNLYEGTEIFNNPEKFNIEIECKGTNPPVCTVINKNGTTGEHAHEYNAHYSSTFMKNFSMAPRFGKLRDHALLHYANTPLEIHEKMRGKIPQPVQPRFL